MLFIGAWFLFLDNGIFAICKRRQNMQEEYSKMRTNDTVTEDEKVSNSQMRDSSAKWILGDPILCSQFLDGYVDIPMLKKCKAGEH